MDVWFTLQYGHGSKSPTKIGSKMGGEFTYPKMGSQNGFDNHGHMGSSAQMFCPIFDGSGALAGRGGVLAARL